MIYTTSDAQDELMRDTDTFTDWLASVCQQKPVDKWRPSIHADTFKAEQLAVYALLAIAMDAGQPGATRLIAIDAIRSTYLLQPDSIHHVNTLLDKREAA